MKKFELYFFFEKYSTNFLDLMTSPENLPENGSRTVKNKIFFTFNYFVLDFFILHLEPSLTIKPTQFFSPHLHGYCL